MVHKSLPSSFFLELSTAWEENSQEENSQATLWPASRQHHGQSQNSGWGKSTSKACFSTLPAPCLHNLSPFTHSIQSHCVLWGRYRVRQWQGDDANIVLLWRSFSFEGWDIQYTASCPRITHSGTAVIFYLQMCLSHILSPLKLWVHKFFVGNS